jgi:hypothetical protein
LRHNMSIVDQLKAKLAVVEDHADGGQVGVRWKSSCYVVTHGISSTGPEKPPNARVQRGRERR